MPTILPITDFLDPQLDIYARLSENQLLNRCDPQNGIFIAESPKVIERALDAGCIPLFILAVWLLNWAFYGWNAARISRFFPPHLRCSHS